MKKNLFSLLAAFFVSGLAVGQSLSAENLDADTEVIIGTPEIGPTGVTEGTLYSNGPYYNVPGTPNISLLENFTVGVTTLGAGHSSAAGIRVADDWEVTENVIVENIQFYAYQTGSSTTSTITGVSLAIWDGPPSDPASSIVWGDQFEDFFDSTEWTGAYRASETNPSDTSRPIMITTANTDGLELAPGTYWLDWDATGSLTSGPWAPPIAILGEDTTGNALQFLPDEGGWGDLLDGGTFTGMGLPFEVNGEVVTAGVNDFSATSISIYPNPTAKFINIKSGAKIESVVVYNLAGQELMKASPKGKNSAFDVSSLPSGTYIIKAVVDGKVQTQKFIKK